MVTEGSSCVCAWRAPAAAPSAALGQTQVLALVLRGEAVVVAATAAEPEARALVLLGVKEPHHGVVLAAALVLAQEAGVCRETHNPVTHRSHPASAAPSGGVSLCSYMPYNP